MQTSTRIFPFDFSVSFSCSKSFSFYIQLQRRNDDFAILFFLDHIFSTFFFPFRHSLTNNHYRCAFTFFFLFFTFLLLGHSLTHSLKSVAGKAQARPAVARPRQQGQTKATPASCFFPPPAGLGVLGGRVWGSEFTGTRRSSLLTLSTVVWVEVHRVHWEA